MDRYTMMLCVSNSAICLSYRKYSFCNCERKKKDQSAGWPFPSLQLWLFVCSYFWWLGIHIGGYTSHNTHLCNLLLYSLIQ